MARIALLSVVLVFLAMLTALVITDISEYGVTPLSVLAIVFLTFFGIALIGSLRKRPPDG